MPLPPRLVDALGQVEDALVHLVIPGRDWDPHIKQKFLTVQENSIFTHTLTYLGKSRDAPGQEDVLCLVGGKRLLPATNVLFVSSWKMPRGEVEDGGGRLVAVAASLLD